MRTDKILLNPFRINCYIYWDESSKEGILIDPAAYHPDEENALKDLVSKSGIIIKYIINTHGHIDHILGNSFAKSYFKVPVLIHKDDEVIVKNTLQYSEYFGLEIKEIPPFDSFIDETSKINAGKSQLTFLHTPGHSPGSICIMDEKNKNVFTGDVLFFESIGRTDLQGGDYEELINSIKKKLLVLCGDDFKIYPGHGETSTIGYERRNNPFLI